MADQIAKIIFTAEDKTEAIFEQVKKGLAAVGIALSAQQFASMIEDTTKAIASYKGLADVAGTTAEKISAFELPARLAGTSLDSVAASVARLGKTLGEARLDMSGEKANLFRALGINVNDGRDAADVMVQVAKTISGMSDQAIAGKIASDLLGKSFVETRRFAKELAEQGELSARVTEQQAEAAKHFEDNQVRLKFASEQLKIALAGDLLGSLNRITDAMVRAQQEGGTLTAIIAGIQTAITGDDAYKNDVAIVELTERKLILENQILAAQSETAVFRGISAAKLKAQLADVDAQLQTALNYKRELEKPTSAPGAKPGGGPDQAAIDSAKAQAAVVKMMEDERARAYTAALATQLGALLEHNQTAEQAIQQTYERRQALLDEAVAKGIITDDFWQGQSMLIFAQYEEAKTRLEDEQTKKRYGISQVYRQLDLNSASAFFGQMGAMMSSHSRTAFQIGKVAAIAGAIIDTYKAATGAYAALAHIPYVGPYLGAAAAAAAIIAGLANVRMIQATEFGGGAGGATPVFSANPVTGVPTGSIGAPPSPVAPVQSQAAAAPTNVHLYFEGGTDRTYSYQEVADEIIPLINEAIGNGINITVSTT